ncbi:hypothetical protein GGS20DRAFT_537641 [Poronia punctata]|nr:hypothetical protein GGS20DRAFT_537641 [Poronia punctata]
MVVYSLTALGPAAVFCVSGIWTSTTHDLHYSQLLPYVADIQVSFIVKLVIGYSKASRMILPKSERVVVRSSLHHLDGTLGSKSQSPGRPNQGT